MQSGVFARTATVYDRLPRLVFGNEIQEAQEYLKTGVVVELWDEKTDSYARSIFIAGIDVYVAGSVMYSPWGVSEARYRKNGEEIRLDGSYMSSIFVVGSKVYVSGSFGATPRYFKNEESIPFNESRNMGTSDIFADAENV